MLAPKHEADVERFGPGWLRTRRAAWTTEKVPGLGPLRSRANELSRLEALVASTREGAGGIVVVEGAAGIGKSRLLAEAGAKALAGGFIVAAGGADELDQATAWGVLLDALRSTTPPVLSSSDLVSVEGLYDQRLAMAEQVQAALERVSTSRPVLMVLDDMQWADPASLLAVGWLARSLFSHPVGWLLALRPLPVKAELDALMGGWLKRARAGCTSGLWGLKPVWRWPGMRG